MILQVQNIKQYRNNQLKSNKIYKHYLIIVSVILIIYFVYFNNLNTYENIDYNFNNDLLIINNFFDKNKFNEINNICKHKKFKKDFRVSSRKTICLFKDNLWWRLPVIASLIIFVYYINFVYYKWSTKTIKLYKNNIFVNMIFPILLICHIIIYFILNINFWNHYRDL